MLTNLHVKNLALIEEADINFFASHFLQMNHRQYAL